MKRSNVFLVLLVSAMGMGSGAVCHAEMIPNKLVAHYTFNGHAMDVTGNGHNGAIFGAELTGDRFGNPNAAYNFNGSGDYINCGNIIDGFERFTVSAWVNIDRYTHSRYMGPWGQQSLSALENESYKFLTANDTQLGCFGTVMRWEDGSLLNSRAGYVLETGEWHLVTQTYDGSQIRQYDNGRLINAVAAEGQMLGNTHDFLIGKTAAFPSGSARTYGFDGQIDDVRIYDRALSQAEIVELYDAVPEPLSVAFICSALMLFMVRRNVCSSARYGTGALYLHLNKLFCQFFLNTASSSGVQDRWGRR